MRFKLLATIYVLILAVECFANLNGNLSLQFFSKPALMICLIFYYFFESRKLNRLKFLILGALVFSWFGDIALLLDKIHKNLFVCGLLAFLAAHIFYIFYFRQIRRFNKPRKSLKPLVLFAVLIYTTILYASLFSFLGNLKIPVFVYSAVISLMLLASFHAFDQKRQNFGKLCVFGTVLFTVSDSILAVNRFVSPIPLASVLIMTTYAAAQLLITEGSLRNLREIEKKLTESYR